MKVLNVRHRKFCEAYIKTNGNATKSVIYADNLPPEKCLTSTVRVKGHRLATNVNIKDEIDRICQEQGFTLDKALKILNNKVQQDSPDQLKALSLWFEVSGNKAPTKSENKTEITQKELSESDLSLARKALLSAKPN